jgi:hypothetical protein
MILAHWGGGFFFYELMPEVARAAADVFYDTAASPFLYRPLIYSLALKIVGPDRILFGSDYPLLPPGRYFSEMAGNRLSARIQAKIKGGNARRLFLKDQEVAGDGQMGYNRFGRRLKELDPPFPSSAKSGTAKGRSNSRDANV